jgi:F0F1-type ATP synthase membrane subunit b/b'
MNPNRDVVELWGREFNIVKSGLSEAQVVSFVNDLVKQHDMLLQRQEHLAALTKLAERTVTEADKLADEAKQEAADQAKAEAAKILADAEGRAKDEAARIIAEAEARAQQIVKEKEAKVMATATEQAEAIKSGAERLADEVKREAEAQARAETSRIIAEAQAKGQQIIREKENEAVALATEQAKAIRAQAEREAEQLLEHEKEKIQPELNTFVRRLHGQLLTELEHLKKQVGAFETDYAQAISQSPDESRPVGSGEKRDDFLEFVRNLDQAESGEPEWELEVLPPIDIMKIMSIVGYLDSLPEVEKTEIIPRNERTSITVFLRQPLEVVEVIRTLPEVAQAEEDTADTDSKPRKVNLMLSGKTGSGEDSEGVGKTSHHLSSESDFKSLIN